MISLGEIEPVRKIQDDLNKTVTMASISRERSGEKNFYQKGAMTQPQVDRAVNMPMNSYVEVEDINGVRREPAQLQSAPYLQQSEYYQQLMEIIMGMPRMQMGGGAGVSTGTATGDSIADTRFEGRNGQKKEDIEELVKDVVYRLYDLAKDNLTSAKLSINGEETEITKDDLVQDPQITVQINTTGRKLS